MPDPAAPVRLRLARSALIAVALFALCVLPLASVHPALLVVGVLPLVAAMWVLRTGVDVDAGAVTVRALVRPVVIAWPDVAGLRITSDDRLWLVRVDGSAVRLPTLRSHDLPRLYAATAGRLGTPALPDRA